jgi:acylphosphatase
MIKHFNIKIYGLVQGVFFRASTKEKADELNLTGFIQNQTDGSVYIETEGEENNLNKFLEWCNQGPLMAKVEKIEVSKDALKNFSHFKIS